MIEKAKEIIESAKWLHPDKPWSKPMPERIVNNKRMQRVQSDAIETEAQGKCPKCGRRCRVASVWITRTYGEHGPIYDRWLAQQEVTCPGTTINDEGREVYCGQFRIILTDEQIDKTYELRDASG